jgi:hypothetical protein
MWKDGLSAECTAELVSGCSGLGEDGIGGHGLDDEVARNDGCADPAAREPAEIGRDVQPKRRLVVLDDRPSEQRLREECRDEWRGKDAFRALLQRAQGAKMCEE